MKAQGTAKNCGEHSMKPKKMNHQTNIGNNQFLLLHLSAKISAGSAVSAVKSLISAITSAPLSDREACHNCFAEKPAIN
jgi:hypothetical protein